jgi:hypothetical protein
MSRLKYLSAYSEQTQSQVAQLIAQDKLAAVLNSRYGKAHDYRTDKALYNYVQELRSAYLRNAEPINKVEYDSKIHVINHALGLHTAIARVQGGKLKAKHEIRAPCSGRAHGIPHHDCCARAGPPEGKAARQGLLPAMHAHGTKLPPVRVRPAPLPDPLDNGGSKLWDASSTGSN